MVTLDSEDDYWSGSQNIMQSPPTVFLKTTLTRTITQDKQLILLGPNHLPTVFLKTTLTWMITPDKQLILLGSNHLPTVFLKTTLTWMITQD